LKCPKTPQRGKRGDYKKTLAEVGTTPAGEKEVIMNFESKEKA